MNGILVPTDFSQHSVYGFQTAVKLAEKVGTTIKLIHIVSTPRDISWVKLSDEEKLAYPETVNRIKKAETDLTKFMEQYAGGAMVTTSVVFDLTFYDLDKYAEEHNTGLIVMGSHGASGYKEFFIGSNAQKVVRVCKTPVLTVKNYNPEVDFDSMVYASSFIKESENAFPKVASLCSELNSRLKLVYINKPNNFETSAKVLERMNRIANLAPGDFDLTIYNDFTDEEGILEYAESVDADIIAIATHGKRGIRAMFSSLTERLINHSDIPVLSLSMYD